MSTTIDLGVSFRGNQDGKISSVKAGTVELQPNQVAIDIVASGVCATDKHMFKDGKIGLGHEGVGIVKQVGSGVESFKEGARVGWGYVHGACLKCDWCIAGVDTLCPDSQMFGKTNLQQGSMGDRYVIDARFLHKIPDSLPLVYAAPLQCAGATVFGAIYNSGVRPFDRVGVLGVGGLGHLAVSMLRKCGCDVVVFSGTDSKKEEAMKLGASEFIATKNGGLDKLTAPVSYLFVSTSVQPDWNLYLAPNVLASRGTIVPLSVSPDPFHLDKYQQVVGRELKIQGSVVASRSVHRQMLAFSARHGIKPIIEELPLTQAGVQEAFDRLEKGDVRYRFVLKHPEHKDTLQN